MAETQGEILRIENLSISFNGEPVPTLAVRGLSLSIEEGKTLGLVGESGCGKSVTAFSVLGLLPSSGRITGGSIKYRGRELTSLASDELRLYRGKEISMIFQEPMTSLNPVLATGYQISEVLRLHLGLSKKEAAIRAVELLDLVGIPDAKKRAAGYPHELSGGMRQRVMIAMALAASPSLLIADEPTTALDVTIQAQILDLLKTLQSERRMSMLLISHDLGVVANMADWIAVMYAGEIVEQGKASDIFSAPLHPYTKGLLKAIPKMGGADDTKDKQDKLYTIPGTVPLLTEEPAGCAFYPRCDVAKDICAQTKCELTDCGQGRKARCLLQADK